MPILVKQIKPSRLKVDALRLELLNAMRKAGTQVKADFEKTTATWKHKPKFEMLISLTQPGPQLLVSTDDEIYGYLDRGTRADYEIWAGYYTGKSNKKALVFQKGYKAKTTPGVIGSGSGGSFGAIRHTPYVVHPGIKARDFEGAIKKKREKWFKGQMEAAMKKAAAASGHAIG